MKKILSILFTFAMVLAFTSCATKPSENQQVDLSSSLKEINSATEVQESSSKVSDNKSAETEKPEFVTITGLDANKEKTEVQIPYDPKRICILDVSDLDIIDNLGLGDRVVGSVDVSMDYLSKYVPSEENGIINVGSVKTPSVEDVMECDPDVIFIGGRLSSYYDQLSEIAPVVYLPTDYDTVLEMTTEKSKTIASLFGMEDKVDSLLSEYQERIDKISKFANKATGMLLITTNGSVNVKGNDGKCSMIFVSCGFKNIGVEEDEYTATHGNITSYEYISKINPEYMFVLDRDSATNKEGAKLAGELLNNELINETDAVKNDRMVILENPDVRYTGEGGITAMGVMLSDLEKGLKIK